MPADVSCTRNFFTQLGSGVTLFPTHLVTCAACHSSFVSYEVFFLHSFCTALRVWNYGKKMLRRLAEDPWSLYEDPRVVCTWDTHTRTAWGLWGIFIFSCHCDKCSGRVTCSHNLRSKMSLKIYLQPKMSNTKCSLWDHNQTAFVQKKKKNYQWFKKQDFYIGVCCGCCQTFCSERICWIQRFYEDIWSLAVDTWLKQNWEKKRKLTVRPRVSARNFVPISGLWTRGVALYKRAKIHWLLTALGPKLSCQVCGLEQSREIQKRKCCHKVQQLCLSRQWF